VDTVFGASGLLRGRIAGGEACDVFVSANLAHAQALAEGRAVRVFARNAMCALTRAELGIRPKSLLERMLDPGMRIGMSTPEADPSGDYALEIFRRADSVRPGAGAALRAKAASLTGAPDIPKPDGPLGVYASIMASRQADIFLTYVTNARAASAETPGLDTIALPPALAVGAEYGLVAVSDRPEAALLATHLLSPAARAILAEHGFMVPHAEA
jgi:ABC-type molybdate transport system substrate-binding protein